MWSVMTTNVTLGMLDLASRPAMQQFVVIDMVELLVRRVDRGWQMVMEQQQQDHNAHDLIEHFRINEDLEGLVDVHSSKSGGGQPETRRSDRQVESAFGRDGRTGVRTLLDVAGD